MAMRVDNGIQPPASRGASMPQHLLLKMAFDSGQKDGVEDASRAAPRIKSRSEYSLCNTPGTPAFMCVQSKLQLLDRLHRPQPRHGLGDLAPLLLDDVEQLGRRASVSVGLLVRVDRFRSYIASSIPTPPYYFFPIRRGFAGRVQFAFRWAS